MVQDFKDLLVWQKAMELVTLVYEVTGTFPSSEKFGLVSQMQRAAVYVASNIAEGQGRLTVGEFRQFLGTARGSLYDLETQILIGERLGLLSSPTAQSLCAQAGDVARLMNGLLRALDKRRSSAK